jgi:hypothetical protein
LLDWTVDRIGVEADGTLWAVREGTDTGLHRIVFEAGAGE